MAAGRAPLPLLIALLLAAAPAAARGAAAPGQCGAAAALPGDQRRECGAHRGPRAGGGWPE
jgi:hypothetical protein